MNQPGQPAANSPAEISPILIGAGIPELTLATADGNTFDLQAAITGKPTIMFFYRGGWCSYCNKQLEQMQNLAPQFTEIGYQIIGISPDQPAMLIPSIEKHKLEYRLLSDSQMTAARALGIAFKVDDKTFEFYKNSNIDIEQASGEKHHLLPVPSVFIIGSDGIIRFEYINPDYKVRLKPDLLLGMAKAALEPAEE